MQRAHLAIGCNTYEHADPLEGPELDAQRIFDQLTEEDVGNYDPAISELLLSPTIGEVTGALQRILFNHGKLDTLTIFFAGHGTINAVGFYMAVRDTRIDQLSTTGLWLSTLLSAVADAAPAQTNIIIDACFSGGVGADLTVFTRPQTFGDVGSPAVALLAMSARNQTAGEQDNGGFGTNALLDCVAGREFVQDHSNSLDLMDIGRAVSHRVTDAFGQQPCLFVLNHNHRSIFCRNPNFQISAETALSKWEPRAFLDAIAPVLAAHTGKPSVLISDIERLNGGMVEKAGTSTDPFLVAQVRASGLVALLEHSGTSPVLDKWMVQEAEAVSDSLRAAIRVSVEALAGEQYAMLAGRGGGLSNLFYLPVRLSKLVGWAGAAFHIDRLVGRQASFPTDEFRKLLRLVADRYGVACTLMSDAQAPYLALALSAAHALGFLEEGEAILSPLLHSALMVKGKIASAHIELDRVPSYLMARHEGDFSEHQANLAWPGEAIVVLMKAAPLFGLADVFNESMEDLDHLPVNAFVADDYSRFGQQYVEGGENASFIIGHDIWTTEDLAEHWPKSADVTPSNTSVATGAILSAALFPDRVPWFVFASLEGEHPKTQVRTAT